MVSFRRDSSTGRNDQGNDFALVSAVNPKIRFGHCDEPMTGIQLAHANEAKIGQTPFPVRVALGQGSQLRQMIVAVESEAYQTFADQIKHQASVLQVKWRGAHFAF
jgi:hypothetical protein